MKISNLIEWTAQVYVVNYNFIQNFKIYFAISKHDLALHCLPMFHKTDSRLILAVKWDFQHCVMCDQQSLRSACAYAQSDQSIC